MEILIYQCSRRKELGRLQKEGDSDTTANLTQSHESASRI